MESESPPHEPSLLDRIRNMWEFANLGQYLFIFGKAIRVDQDLDIEVAMASSLCYMTSTRIFREKNREEWLIRITHLGSRNGAIEATAFRNPLCDRLSPS